MRPQNEIGPVCFSRDRFIEHDLFDEPFLLQCRDEFSSMEPGISALSSEIATPSVEKPRLVRDFRDEDVTYEDAIVRPLIPDCKNCLVFKGEYIDEDPLLDGLPSYRMPHLDLRGIEKGIGSVFSLIIRKIQITGKKIHIPKDLLHSRKETEATVVKYMMRDPLPVKAEIVKTYLRDNQNLIREECAVFHQGTCLAIIVRMFFRDNLPTSTFFSLPEYVSFEEDNHLIRFHGCDPSSTDSNIRSEIIEQVRMGVTPNLLDHCYVQEFDSL